MIFLKKALFVLWPGLYFLSVFLFAITYFWVKKDFDERAIFVPAAERYGKSKLNKENEFLIHTDPTAMTT